MTTQEDLNVLMENQNTILERIAELMNKDNSKVIKIVRGTPGGVGETPFYIDLSKTDDEVIADIDRTLKFQDYIDQAISEAEAVKAQAKAAAKGVK